MKKSNCFNQMSEANPGDSKSRFEFGKNWLNFIRNLTEESILEAEKSLKEKLGVADLNDKIFLDVGCGSGLFSLAAYRLGAKVLSFDYDIASVNCALILKDKHAKGSEHWSIEQGSVLDQDFIKKFGMIDVVYSWGVLHHTGDMDKAFHNISFLVKDGGQLFISIYNDQGNVSQRWKWIKKKYNSSGYMMKMILSWYTAIRCWAMTFFKDFFRAGNPFRSWVQYGKNNRGMSAWHDVVDWVGGYPFEVAKPEEVFHFFKRKGYVLEDLKTCSGGIGCNEFIFRKIH
jgi:2-polyprenyl-6-hydroxyphenyl methylase/3-demethylubiquinone-9 3-methyltransferase